MVPRKSLPYQAAPTARLPAQLSSSVVPASLQFPLLVTLSLALSSALYSVAAAYTARDLGSVSRSLDEWWEVGGLIAWRTLELGLGWWCNYDGVDLASLTLLSHLPPLYLLHTFYSIQTSTVITSLFIDILATYLPFRLLRPLSPVHSSTAPESAGLNRSIIEDIPIRLLTTLFAAAIYGTVIFASYQSWLPVCLVTHFDGIRDISAAHSPALPMLVATCVPIGYAAKEFLFTTSAGSRGGLGDASASSFDPATATLFETVYYNFWGFSKRSKLVITRTATLVFVTSLNTWLQTFVTIKGVENYGAVGYAALWASAGALTGLAFLWVGNV